MKFRQGAIYEINCSDCDQCYIGEIKRWFETRKKEHMSFFMSNFEYTVKHAIWQASYLYAFSQGAKCDFAKYAFWQVLFFYI